MFKKFQISFSIIFVLVFSFLFLSQHAGAVLCGSDWKEGNINIIQAYIYRSNGSMSNNEMFLSLFGSITDGLCSQECYSQAQRSGKWAVANPVSFLEYRFDSNDVWSLITRKEINGWTLVDPASPASPDCVSEEGFSEAYKSYKYSISTYNINITALGLSIGEHTLHLRATYETDKYFYKDIEVDVPALPEVKVNLSADPTNIESGQSSTLTWTSSNVANCSASAVPVNSQWSGSVATIGSKEISNLTDNTTFTISCSSSNGSTMVSNSVNVNVTSPTPTITPTPTEITEPSSIVVKATLNGEEWTGDLNYIIVGPESFEEFLTPQTFSNVQSGIYTISYLGGGPNGSEYLGISPASSLWVGENGSVQFTFQFGTTQVCDIEVKATKDGNAYTGDVSYRLAGPSYYDGNYASYTYSDVPAGLYYLAYVSGGPGTISSISPMNPIYCFPDNAITFTMNFTGGATPTPVATNNNNLPQADILCWATKDSDRCLGQIDGNNDTPSVILYNRSTDDDNDIKSCYWEVLDSSDQKVKEQSTCAPLVWGDTLGSYSATLRIVDSNGNADSVVKDFRIIDVSELTCDFVWDPEAPKAANATDFFDASLTPSGTTIKSWSWSFEGGTPEESNLSDPSGVIFASAGEKTVSLTVKNSAGKTDTCSQEIQVKTISPKWKEVIPE